MSDPAAGPVPVTVPVIEERIEIERRAVDLGGLRLTRRVEEEAVPVEVTLGHESLRVEQVAIGRTLGPDEHPEPRIEGDTVVVPVVEETLVVEVRRVLREELRITRERHEERVRRTVNVRRDRIEMAPIAPANQESNRHG